MNDQHIEPVETIEDAYELSDQDKADLAALHGEPAGGPGAEDPHRPILEVWREVLKPAEAESRLRVNPQWGTRLVQAYVGVTFADLNRLRDIYYGKMFELIAVLHMEIDSDPDCLSYTTVEEDAEHNRAHYLNLMLIWQQMFQRWELDWDCEHPDAAIQLAAMSELLRMFFGDSIGLTAHLQSIPLDYTEEDQALIREALVESAGGEQ